MNCKLLLLMHKIMANKLIMQWIVAEIKMLNIYINALVVLYSKPQIHSSARKKISLFPWTRPTAKRMWLQFGGLFFFFILKQFLFHNAKSSTRNYCCLFGLYHLFILILFCCQSNGVAFCERFCLFCFDTERQKHFGEILSE